MEDSERQRNSFLNKSVMLKRCWIDIFIYKHLQIYICVCVCVCVCVFALAFTAKFELKQYLNAS